MSTTEPLEPGRGFGTAIVGTIVPAVLVFGLLVINLVAVPSAKKTFDEYGMTLPWGTQNLIRLSNWVCAYWWMLVPPLVLMGAGNFVLLKALGQRGRAFARTWIAGVSLSLLGVIALTLVSIALPM